MVNLIRFSRFVGILSRFILALTSTSATYEIEKCPQNKPCGNIEIYIQVQCLIYVTNVERALAREVSLVSTRNYILK